MSDNFDVNVGSGRTIGTDQTSISSVLVDIQRITLGAGPNLTCANVPISSTSTAVDLFAFNDNAKERLFQPLDGDIYVGPSGVTSSTGFKVSAGQSLGTNFIGLLRVLAVNSGTVNVRTWEVY